MKKRGRNAIAGILACCAAAQGAAWGACFNTVGVPAGGSITAVMTPSRISGVAPLAVFFDSTGTVAAAATRPFHELSYCWDFGDPGSGTFATDGKPKNEARGPLAGHVFEAPGTYNVTMTVRDAQDREATQSVTIMVQDPDTVFVGTNTKCFSSSGDFTGCPVGAQQVLVTGLSGLDSHVAPGRRLLLRRGDTFPANATGTSVTLNVAGPGLIGTFGPATDPRPVLQTNPTATAFAPMFYISGNSRAFSDWRLVDLEMDGSAALNSNGIYIAAGGDNLLVLRVQGHDMFGALRAGGGTYQSSNGLVDGVAVQDSDFRRSVKDTNGNGGNVIFLTGRRLMLIGSNVEDSTGGEHLVRMPWVDRGVISHNIIGLHPHPRTDLKLHAPPVTASGALVTERIVISHNEFLGAAPGTTGGTGSVNISPENASTDEHVKDVILERNLFRDSPNVRTSIYISAQRVTVRDNIFHRGVERNCVDINRDAQTIPTEFITVVHNTCFGTGPAVHMVGISSAFTGTVVANNLIVGPGAAVAYNTPSTPEIPRISVLGPNPTFPSAGAAGFASSSPGAVASDFMLNGTSPAIGVGDPVYRSLWDHSGAQRTDAVPDVGAWEAAGPPDPLPPARPKNLRVR